MAPFSLSLDATTKADRVDPDSDRDIVRVMRADPLHCRRNNALTQQKKLKKALR